MSETDVGLSALPEGWVWTTLDEISQPPQYGWTTSAKNRGKLRLLRTTDITSGYINWETVPFCQTEPDDVEKYLLKDGDIVISRSGSVGYSHLIKEPDQAIFASYLIRFRPVIIDELFLSYFLKSSVYWRAISESKLGIAVQNVNATKLRKISLPIAPLPEQHRIVAKIEELFTKLDAGKEELLQAKARLKRYRQSVLKAAMDGKLTEDWRKKQGDEIEPASVLLERILKDRREKWEAEQLEQMSAKGKMPKDDKWKNKYKEPPGPDTSRLPDLPKGWVWVTLPQIGELNRGKSKHRPRNASFLYGGQYPFVQTGDIKQANGLIGHYNQTYSEEGLKQSRLWPAGTLCITIAANIADTAILGFDACFPDSVVGFLPEIGHCNIRFVEFFLRTAKDDLEQYAPATAQKNINLGTLKGLAIPFPPLAEQNVITEEIDRHLSVADAVEAIVDAELKRSDALRQSILKQAFSGKLVPQDPNDEPAKKLLARIKKEKAKLETEQKAKRKTKKQLALFEH